MPPKSKYTKEEIISAAFEMTRESGIASVTARGVSARLGSSAKPIFGLFANMEELHREVIKAADGLYQSYLQEDMAAGKYPPYKASGMAYIRFAREEKELFKLLFMRDRSDEEQIHGTEMDYIIPLICKITGLDTDTAWQFHLDMWIFVHGIAAMTATGYLDWDEEKAGEVLTDAYLGLKERFKAIPHKDCACIAQSDFSSDCINST